MASPTTKSAVTRAIRKYRKGQVELTPVEKRALKTKYGQGVLKTAGLVLLRSKVAKAKVKAKVKAKATKSAKKPAEKYTKKPATPAKKPAKPAKRRAWSRELETKLRKAVDKVKFSRLSPELLRSLKSQAESGQIVIDKTQLVTDREGGLFMAVTETSRAFRVISFPANKAEWAALEKKALKSPWVAKVLRAFKKMAAHAALPHATLPKRDLLTELKTNPFETVVKLLAMTGYWPKGTRVYRKGQKIAAVRNAKTVSFTLAGAVRNAKKSDVLYMPTTKAGWEELKSRAKKDPWVAHVLTGFEELRLFKSGQVSKKLAKKSAKKA